MSPDREPPRVGNDQDDADAQSDDSPRSIFSALWFRALLTVLVLGVLAAVAVPYVLDLATAPKLMATPAKTGAVAPAAPVTAAPATATLTAAPADTAAPAVATESSSPTPSSPSGPEAAAGQPPAPAPGKSQTSKPAATKSRTVAKAAETPKPQARAPEAEKAAPKAAEAAKPAPAKAASGGPYWVQVGAFKDPETAKRLAARLREQGLRVEESTTTATVSPRAAAAPAAAPRAADRYDVAISGASPADIDAKLAPKGLKGEATANGVVVRPSLTLREAVALSRDLADAGLSVQVRRIGGPAATSTASPTASAPMTLHRVRVGSFPDRVAAIDAMKRLEDKGLKPFLARGNE